MDFSQQVQEQNQIAISSFSPEAIGVEMNVLTDVSVNGAWPAANRAIYIPFQVYGPLVAYKLSVFNGATVSGNIDIGIYDGPGNRLVSAGSTAMSGGSVLQSVDITDTTLYPGNYYMALAVDNTTATFIRLTGSVLQFFGAAGVYSQSTAFALPATATFAACLNAYVPIIVIHTRVLV